MCGIIITNDSSQLYNLYEANAARGKHSFSFCAISRHGEIITLERHMGLLTATHLSSLIADVYSEAALYIMHNQAPTGDARDVSSIHPYYNPDDLSYTWHNGIIKPDYVERKFPGVKWDTIALSRVLGMHNMAELSIVDGSFAFVYMNSNEILIGRNTICPLYKSVKDDWFYISSVPLNTSYKEIEAEVIFKLTANGELGAKSFFKTYQMPYYLGDDD